MGDFDADGDLHLYDDGMMQIGYAAEDMQEFVQVFDFDLDDDIDLDDYAVSHLWRSEPK